MCNMLAFGMSQLTNMIELFSVFFNSQGKELNKLAPL